MKDTLDKIKAHAERARSFKDDLKDGDLQSAIRRHEAARLLLQAFSDVQDQFVRVDILKAIWPEDYQRRNDRARGLLAGVLGGERYPHGLRLYIPGGYRTFDVQESWDGTLSYIVARETYGMRPHIAHFSESAPWLDAFYETMAALIDV